LCFDRVGHACVQSENSVGGKIMPGSHYTDEEDQIILEHMKGTNFRSHDTVTKRAQQISDQFLPHRNAEAIGDHWYYLIGKKVYIPKWIKDLARTR
jgi:hypothetical protein